MELEMSMQELMDQIDQSFKELDRGDLVNGEIVSITDAELVVGLGLSQDGVVPKTESGLSTGVPLKDGFEIGQRIDAVVTHPNHPGGYIELSIKKALSQVEKLALAEAIRESKVIEVKVLEEIKGGYRIAFGTTQGFMPHSQSGVGKTGNAADLFTGVFQVKVTEYDDKRFVVSRRVVLDEARSGLRDKRFSELREGEVHEGTITKLMPFGAFVDLGGIEGLIPMGELSWKHVKEASEVLKEGQRVEVKIRSIRQDEKKISLSLKDLIENPFERIEQDYEVGELVDCSIRGILPFGLKLQLPNGAVGFVHKNELNLPDAQTQLGKHFKIGDALQASVIGFDDERKQVVMSCLEQEDDSYDTYLEENEEEATGVTLGDLFKGKFDQFKK